MPKIYLGNNKTKKIWLGNTPIKKIWLGNNLVFSGFPDDLINLTEGTYDGEILTSITNVTFTANVGVQNITSIYPSTWNRSEQGLPNVDNTATGSTTSLSNLLDLSSITKLKISLTTEYVHPHNSTINSRTYRIRILNSSKTALLTQSINAGQSTTITLNLSDITDRSALYLELYTYASATGGWTSTDHGYGGHPDKAILTITSIKGE